MSFNPEIQEWITVDKPGFLGKEKDRLYSLWNEKYGFNSWRLMWILKNEELLDYSGIFWKIYVPSYLKYFQLNLNEAIYLTQNYAYTYDKDLITKKQAFDPYALYNQPNRPNQFHNVALNIALEYYLCLPFQGENIIQIREGKLNSPIETWPTGWKWSPGRIPAARQDLVIDNEITGWWHKGSIEDVYQTSKVLQIKNGKILPDE